METAIRGFGWRYPCRFVQNLKAASIMRRPMKAKIIGESEPVRIFVKIWRIFLSRIFKVMKAASFQHMYPDSDSSELWLDGPALLPF